MGGSEAAEGWAGAGSEVAADLEEAGLEEAGWVGEDLAEEEDLAAEGWAGAGSAEAAASVVVESGRVVG